MTEPTYLTSVQAAERLGVCASTLRRWDDRHSFASHRTLGGHRRFRAADIDALAGALSDAELDTIADAAERGMQESVHIQDPL